MWKEEKALTISHWINIKRQYIESSFLQFLIDQNMFFMGSYHFITTVKAAYCNLWLLLKAVQCDRISTSNKSQTTTL